MVLCLIHSLVRADPISLVAPGNVQQIDEQISQLTIIYQFKLSYDTLA